MLKITSVLNVVTCSKNRTGLGNYCIYLVTVGWSGWLHMYRSGWGQRCSGGKAIVGAWQSWGRREGPAINHLTQRACSSLHLDEGGGGTQGEGLLRVTGVVASQLYHLLPYSQVKVYAELGGLEVTR